MQVLETEAGNVALGFVAFSVGLKSMSEAERKQFTGLVEDVNRRTFGNLMRQIKDVVDFDDQIIDILDSALERRNYLVHRFFRSHNFAIFSHEGRKHMIDELKDIQAQIEAAYVSLSSIASFLGKMSGMEPGLSEASDLVDKGRRVKI